MSEVKAISMSPEDVRELLLHIRGAARIIAKITPTEIDDRLLVFLDLILGSDQPATPTEVAKLSIPWDRLPWEKLLPLLIPIIEKRLPEILSALVEYFVSLLGKKADQ